MRKLLVVAVLGLAMAVGGGSVAWAGTGRSTGAAQEPYCGIRWGSLAKEDAAYTSAPMTNVRAGRHACFDRLVIDLGARVSPHHPQGDGYRAEYVSQVTQDGSGDPVPLAGGAFIQLLVHAVTFDMNTGVDTYAPADPARIVNVAGFTTFRQVALGGSFEGQTTIGLGVRARLPFRVFALAGPGAGSRLVIDVAHRW